MYKKNYIFFLIRRAGVFALPSSSKSLQWQPDTTFLLYFMLLPEGYNDVSIHGFISISFSTKEKNQLFHIKKVKTTDNILESLRHCCHDINITKHN